MLVNLSPQKIAVTAALSFPFYRKEFRTALETGRKLDWYDLDPDEDRKTRVGQMLGHANAGDVRENLYRQVAFGRMGRRRLMDDDYWRSMEEYEAYMEKWKGSEQLVTMYERMRPGVMWIVDHLEEIDRQEAEWRHLFRVNSNVAMNLWINDADPLYVFIRNEDLAAGRFDDLAGEVTQG